MDLPLPDESLDAVITVNTVYFVADLDRAFAEIARVLRPTGRAVIGVGDPDTMAAMAVTAHGFTIRPIDELVGALRAPVSPSPAWKRVGQDERGFRLWWPIDRRSCEPCLKFRPNRLASSLECTSGSQ